MPAQMHTYILSPERSRYIDERLNPFMKEKEPFLQVDYCIRDLAEDLEIPAYQLSAYINRTMGLNFNGYINWYRVGYCEALIRQGLADELNMKGLALKCGFYNRNSLTAAFKRFTGLTPSDYQKTWKDTLAGEFEPSNSICQEL